MTARWSPFHLRLHRLLRQRPALLPRETPLLVAVSGGQDSMALTGLLLDLRRLHGWELHLWHGDHGWREESATQAGELREWAQGQDLPFTLECWEGPTRRCEATARDWRYACLARQARRLGAGRVVTGHTADDRAETLLLHLARGSHRRGLGSMTWQRRLDPAITLVRPLLAFSRGDTAGVCAALALPIWTDSSNQDGRYSRNRVRHEVLPVLEALHPGAGRRLAATAERMAAEQDTETELLELALVPLLEPDGTDGTNGTDGMVLNRRRLVALTPATQGRLLQHWIRSQLGRPLSAPPLELLLQRLAWGRPPGALDLTAGWQVRWDRSTLRLHQR